MIVDAAAAESLAAGSRTDALTTAGRERPFVHWLARVRPVYDPDELAREAREGSVELIETSPAVSEAVQRSTRSFITHDLRVNQALLLRSDDPVIRVALGMRQLHTFVAVVQAWVTARGLRSEGWKKDILRLAKADASFLAIIERWLTATDVESRHEIFVEAVRHALAPLGGPLPDETVMSDSEGVWEHLVRTEWE